MKRFGAVAVVLCGGTVLATAWAADTTPARGGEGRSATGNSAVAVGSPVLGYVGRSSPMDLRAILGVPGSAVFGDPLLIPSETTSVRVAPGQSSSPSWAWLERGSETPAVLILGGIRDSNLTGLTGALPSADLAAFSPLGTSLALYSASSGRLQIISGLPGSPRIAQDLGVNSGTRSLPGTLDAIAVSDDAAAVLLASGRVVYLLPSDGAPQPVLNLTGAAGSGPAGLTFIPGGHDAAVVDRVAGGVHLVRTSGGSVSPGLVASGLIASGLVDAGEMNFSNDGQNLVITHPAANSVWMVNAGSGEVRSFATPVGPSRLVRLTNPDTFLISAEAGQPAWVFLAANGNGRTVFVPAAQPGHARRD